MLIKKTELPVAHVLRDVKDWNELKQQALSTFKRRRIAHKSALTELDWNKININDYLLTHSTICASIDHEDDGYTIKESCSSIVNANGNAWLNEVLGPSTNMYRSFVGADNFVEHVQVPSQSKGKVLDAAIRKVKHNDSQVWYVDILVATDKKHKDLVSRIASLSLNTMSMGIIAAITQCSKCGKVIYNEWENCPHLKYELGQEYKTKYGTKSKVAELIGIPGHPESGRFIDASWVESPAFQGAVINYIVSNEALHENLLKHASFTNNVTDVDFKANIKELKKIRVADKRGMLSLGLYIKELEKINKQHRIVNLSRQV